MKKFNLKDLPITNFNDWVHNTANSYISHDHAVEECAHYSTPYYTHSLWTSFDILEGIEINVKE